LGTPQQQPTLKFHKIGEKLLPVLPTELGENTLAKGLLPYCFKLPTTQQSLGLLNGLCKFEDPLLRLQGTLKDWLLKLWIPPKPTVHSPKEWSVTACLQVAKALLEATVTEFVSEENRAFHLYFWQWEEQQCKPQPWLKALWPADVAWQPWLQTTTPLVPDKTTLHTLTQFFQACTLGTHWFNRVKEEQLSPEVALWGALWEQHTLPWLAVVDSTKNTPALTNYPYLHRLWQAYQASPHPNHHPDPFATAEGAKNKQSIRKIVLVEGQSERCLLPAIGSALGICFEAKGIWVLASGGKSATLQKCLSLLAWVNVPISVLLDADAQPEADQLTRLAHTLNNSHPALGVWVLTEGELEDTYPLTWVYAVLDQLQVGQEKDPAASPFIAHGMPARIPSFAVFEAFVLDAKAKGERASETFRRFWLAWGYPTFDKRELAEGIAKIVGIVGVDEAEENSLLVWLKGV
jgi:hypothetical protein